MRIHRADFESRNEKHGKLKVKKIIALPETLGELFYLFAVEHFFFSKSEFEDSWFPAMEKTYYSKIIVQGDEKIKRSWTLYPVRLDGKPYEMD